MVLPVDLGKPEYNGRGEGGATSSRCANSNINMMTNIHILI